MSARTVADHIAVTPEVRTCAHDPKPTGMYEPFDTACCKCGDFLETGEQACKSHPDAPHGFDRTASHSLGRYVCECEGWEPPNVEVSG